ncbi:unnamed protein product [Hydatigera taeniaeformis]|uniref:V-SNARE domain-containing protein n=1 Tax=Hydatigena taeniaeformis TaxID=6205 RepID=A0A0R3WJE6_HYDTA|nr:unnamed protein product [Hydatigera taeniaeformis]
MSELPQFLMEVKTADMDILSDAVKSFNSVPSLPVNKFIVLPQFYHPTNVKKLQMDASLLRGKVEQLEEKLLLFRGLNTDLEAAADDVAATEAELLQLQRGDDLSHGLSGWK